MKRTKAIMLTAAAHSDFQAPFHKKYRRNKAGVSLQAMLSPMSKPASQSRRWQNAHKEATRRKRISKFTLPCTRSPSTGRRLITTARVFPHAGKGRSGKSSNDNTPRMDASANAALQQNHSDEPSVGASCRNGLRISAMIGGLG